MHIILTVDLDLEVLDTRKAFFSNLEDVLQETKCEILKQYLDPSLKTGSLEVGFHTLIESRKED